MDLTSSRTVKTVGELEFYIRKFEPLKSIRVMARIQRSLLGPAAPLIASQRGSDVTNEEFIQGIKDISLALDEATLINLLGTIIDPEYVAMKTRSGDAAKATADNLDANCSGPEDIFMLAWEVAQVNFMNIGKRGATLIGRDQPK